MATSTRDVHPASSLGLARAGVSLVLALFLLDAHAQQQETGYTPISKEKLDQWALRLFDGARPRVYAGDRLGHLALPLGGIGTGSVALNGEGRLVQWQVFNNFEKSAQINDTFFAVWVRPDDGEASARLLQTAPYGELPTVGSIAFVGEYPFARLSYIDPALPVDISLEAFNPMVPLNARDSALPCALFTFRVANRGATPCDVSLLSSLQNAIGYSGRGRYDGSKHHGFVRNVNRVEKVAGATMVSLGAQEGEPASFDRPVRLFTHVLGKQAATCGNLTLGQPGRSWTVPVASRLARDYDVLWIDRVSGRDLDDSEINQLADAVEAGTSLLLTGAGGSLVARYATAPAGPEPALPPPEGRRPEVRFEDFETGAYSGWTLEGEAFGDRPAAGTLAGQQTVTGFQGNGLVNTFISGDGPQGTATSKPFRIERRYISFLIGGGARAGQTCMDLLVEGKVVRSATGKDLERLERVSWDVGRHAGREARLRIVDHASGGWGHVNVDDIVFTDWADTLVFEDFESGTYAGWTLEGDAFGGAPASGTLPHQQAVSGFHGGHLVNTYLDRDTPQGMATSKLFRIERPYINFLIGGGAHEEQTCVNLVVDGEAVLSATGKEEEALESVCWDVRAHMGKEARLQIVDRSSGGWGHINVDQIVFSTSPNAIPTPPLTPRLAALLPFTCDGLLPEGPRLPARELTGLDAVVLTSAPGQQLGPLLRLDGVQLKPESQILLRTPQGEPLLVKRALGKGNVLVLLADIPLGPTWTQDAAFALGLVATAAGATFTPATGLDPAHRYWGTMALCTTAEAEAAAQWSDPAALWEDFRRDGRLSMRGGGGPSAPGTTWNAAIAVPARLEPGEETSVTFLLAWHFPNHYYVVSPDVRIGNKYNVWFSSALDVAKQVLPRAHELHRETLAYHDAIYDTTLPYYVVDALTSQADVIRSQTCMWSEAGHFLGFEGNACCPMNCTHVWNYAQTMAKLFPSLERNVREIDLGVQLRENGMVGHRCAVPPTEPASSEATDGQCGTVLKTYREYLQSPDDTWLRAWYAPVKRAMQFLIEKDAQAQPDADLDAWVPVQDRRLLKRVLADTEPDGIILSAQWNTYDCSLHGPNPFVGTLYLAALRAAEEMAKVCEDPSFASQCRALFERGRYNVDELMWREDFGYYVQTYDEKRITAQQFGWGCHCDQTMGQWWADLLELGPILPPERVRSALENVFRHNWRTNFRGHRQRPRVYALDDDKGLLICTWPHGRRPAKVTNYSDEIWTGIEYEVAAELMYQGLVKEGLMVVLGCRERYDGVLRPNTCCDVGNPFDEVECGTNYARAMASWSVLLALQGYLHNGPRGLLGFRPRITPDDHRSFFTAAEGWGVFAQTRQARTQTETLDLRYGRLVLRELVFRPPSGVAPKVVVTIAGQPVKATSSRAGEDVRILLPTPAALTRGQTLQVAMAW